MFTYDTLLSLANLKTKQNITYKKGR